MAEKTRPPPGNRNVIVTVGFSNSESEKRYRNQWPGEPELYAQYHGGDQCGGCTFFAPFNEDYGLCCNERSRHFTETVFEHFTCANSDQEGWGAHSFEAKERRNDGRHARLVNWGMAGRQAAQRKRRPSTRRSRKAMTAGSGGVAELQ